MSLSVGILPSIINSSPASTTREVGHLLECRRQSASSVSYSSSAEPPRPSERRAGRTAPARSRGSPSGILPLDVDRRSLRRVAHGRLPLVQRTSACPQRVGRRAGPCDFGFMPGRSPRANRLQNRSSPAGVATFDPHSANKNSPGVPSPPGSRHGSCDRPCAARSTAAGSASRTTHRRPPGTSRPARCSPARAHRAPPCSASRGCSPPSAGSRQPTTVCCGCWL